MSGGGHSESGPLTRVATVLIFIGLLVALVANISTKVEGRLAAVGNSMWPGFTDVLVDPEPPECSLEELDEKLAQCPPEGEDAPPSEVEEGGDPFGDAAGDEDPFGDAAEEADPFGDAAEEEDPFGDAAGDADPFGDAAEAADPFGDAAEGKQEADPFGDAAEDKEEADPFGDAAEDKEEADPFGDAAAGDDDPFGDAVADDDPFGDAAAGDDDPFGDAVADDDPFGDAAEDDPFADKPEPKKPPVNCPAVRNLRDRCAIRHQDYEDKAALISNGSVRTYRSVYQGVRKLGAINLRYILTFLLLLGGFVTVLRGMHIALRDPETLLEHRVRHGGELLAHLFLSVGCGMLYRVESQSSAEADDPMLPVLWGLGFFVMAAVNAWHLSRKPDHIEEGPASVPRLLMVVPLFAWMVIIAGIWFNGIEMHLSGAGIYIHKFVQIPNIYTGIGLYIWGGMLLAQTRMAHYGFDMLTPWRLPPAILAWLVVVLAAFPTAYSGASGIFVIAAGAIIFERMTDSGASKRLALMTTAMSGSLGVVLRPCLVVVLISVLNDGVTTDALFGNGIRVYLLTATLFLAAMGIYTVMTPVEKSERPVSDESPATLAGRAFMGLLPYLVITAVVVGLFVVVLDTWVNEHSAPTIVPIALLLLVFYDHMLAPHKAEHEQGVWPSLVEATDESSTHIGALLFVMMGSVGFGGVVERAEVMNIVPESLGSQWTTMAVLVVIMVLVGMTMDALGAVILVSITVAQIAYDNGIDKVHFWMMVLVAFELGYLTPPVALNHLLARQVIGEAAKVERDAESNFWRRYEHIWVPMAVMGTALIIVAFLPLAVPGLLITE